MKTGAIHPSQLTKALVAQRNDQIELFYLHSYSPQLNPEERLAADLKKETGKLISIKTNTKLRDAVNDHMALLEQTRSVSFATSRIVGLVTPLKKFPGGINDYSSISDKG